MTFPLRPFLAALPLALAALVGFAAPAAAATGVCDSNPPTTNTACINAIQASGGVVNDIFRDSNGRTGAQLPLFGKVVNIYPGCNLMNCAGCNPGISNAPFDCPGQYTCPANGACTIDTLRQGVNALDRKWGHPCRLSDHTLVNGCPNYAECVADGTPGNYVPWEGLVFDLGGPSNQVAIFAENDHGPQPCESVEYTVYLTDDYNSRDIVLQPTTAGADPKKWNRAVLKKIFTKGFVEVRSPDPAGHAACGDTAQYSVEEDSMVTVYGLPCGINFRYAAIVAGNDGRDFPACAFDSQEAELDAVAGLTEQGAGVCPDADKDGYVDCGCAGAPAVCDCDDNDANTHPNAPEACDAPKDFNCNKVRPEPCPPGKTCFQSQCLAECQGTEFACAPGATCTTSDAGKRLCVPDDCTIGGCPPGAACDPQSKKCVQACALNVVCPPGQNCVSGACVDPCRTLKCQSGFTCIDGACTPPCSCFAGDVGCTAGKKCDRPGDAGAGSNQCVAPACLGKQCPAGKHCTADGGCADYCDGVRCPTGEVCVPPPGTAGADGGLRYGCVNLCDGVSCPAGVACDPQSGRCGSADGGFGLDDGGEQDASFGDGGGAGGTQDEGGCSCSTAGSGGGSLATALGLSGLVAVGLGLLARRRRRSG